MANGQLISIIVPIYNEKDNVPVIYRALKKVFSPLPFKHELIFVNDGSTDETANALGKVTKKDEQVTVLDLARNFGKEIAITAGLHQANGDAAIIIDADLEHPPHLIPEFITKWEEGADIVVGVRNTPQKRISKRVTSKLFYWLINSISQVEIKPDATDYRLLDRRVVNEFNKFTERNRIARGLVDWLGFRRDYIYFNVGKRQNGTATYSFRKLLHLATCSIVSLSVVPLRFVGYMGLLVMMFAAPLAVIVFVERYIYNNLWGLHFSGSAILAVILLFLVGLVLAVLGLISLYISDIHDEVVNRPLYVVQRKR